VALTTGFAVALRLETERRAEGELDHFVTIALSII
jgi:hypothetical protein